jgi:propionyl-CoA carboxylase alpha chain
MFTKILIANRGEIACRVIASAREMGIQTVAVYSEADVFARHVALADEAYLIGAAPARQSYLLGDKIIEVALSSAAQAIHPGYGFLSENEAFAKAVEEAGLVFIGPKHASISAMGDKIASKKLAQAAQVSTIPGYNEAIVDAKQAVEIAQKIGYPVMIKASAGGGGKGLRVSWSDEETQTGFVACQNEARNSFGDDRIFIEKCIESPRHIEIQILGDAFGHVVYLNERECSIQRRHQKVIEEAPSAFISSETRRAMGEQAVALAKAVNYQSAGTVEFVVGADQGFYFLEMNTRLQVEHPVTEAITGVDLVKWMIKIAAGEPLSLKQSDIKIEGWAMECRINAEDPYRQFLPSTGRLVKFVPPPTTMRAAHPDERFGVRVDTGVSDGGEISVHYDSMIAKLIVQGKDRAEATQKMREALNGFVVRGVQTNIAFQSAILAHPQWVSTAFNTGFIAEHFPKGLVPFGQVHPEPDFLVALGAWVHLKSRARAHGMDGQMQGFTLEHPNEMVLIEWQPPPQTHRHHALTVSAVSASVSHATVHLNGQDFEIVCTSQLRDSVLEGVCNGRPFVAQLERHLPKHPMAMEITQYGAQLRFMVVSPRVAALQALMPQKLPLDLSRFVLSPMPGLLTQVLVQAGQKVLAGERLAVIEAMKMENVLVAAQDAVVKSIQVKVGDTLAVDQIMVEFL